MAKALASFLAGAFKIPFVALMLVFPSAVIVPPILAGLGVVSWNVPVLVWLFIMPTMVSQIVAFVLLFRWGYI